MTKIFNKQEPHADGNFFIPLPSDTRHYVHHPRMGADRLFLYTLIIDYYNPKEGFAFPSIETLAVNYGKAQDTTSRHLDDLKAAGLIDFEDKGFYLPLVPLNQADFFAKFPEARARYEQATARADARKQAAKLRAQEWRSKYQQ